MMNLVDCMKALLRREFSDEECKVLRHLTAQGLAKLNCDIARGVELEVTMAILRVVYRRMEKRREEIFCQIAPEVQAAIEKLNRTATAEELIFLNDCYETNLFKNLVRPDGEFVDDFDLENSAIAYLYTELGMEADRLRSGLQAGLARNAMKCSVCHLAPMTCPISFTSATMVRTNEFHRMRIGYNPMVAWFDVSQAEPLLISPNALHHLTPRSGGCFPSPSTPWADVADDGEYPASADSIPSSLGLSSYSSTDASFSLEIDSPGCDSKKKDCRVRFMADPENSKKSFKEGPKCQENERPNDLSNEVNISSQIQDSPRSSLAVAPPSAVFRSDTQRGFFRNVLGSKIRRAPISNPSTSNRKSKFARFLSVFGVSFIGV